MVQGMDAERLPKSHRTISELIAVFDESSRVLRKCDVALHSVHVVDYEYPTKNYCLWI